MRNYYGLRCSAKRVTQHKVTFRHENGSASGTYTSSVGYADTCLAAARVSSSSASGTAGLGSHREPIQYRAPASQPSRGSQGWGRAARLANKHFYCPNTETFSAVHNISVTCRSRLARSPGGLGGRSRIEFIVSPLPRRRNNESHFAAEPPERSFFFPLFLSPRKKKRLLSATQL